MLQQKHKTIGGVHCSDQPMPSFPAAAGELIELRFSLRSCRIELDAGAILAWTCSVLSAVRIEKRIKKGRSVKKMRTVFHNFAPESILSRLTANQFDKY